MDRASICLLLAVVLVILLPVVPSMVQFRIRVLRWMGLDSMARFHEKGLPAIVVVVRAVLIALAIALLATALPEV